MKPKKPFIPVERQETVRKQIISVLEGQTLSAKEISALVKVSEKEVYSHLEHIQKTINIPGNPAAFLPASAPAPVLRQEDAGARRGSRRKQEAGQGKKGSKLIIIPAECRKCRFVFKKRDRLKKPGKCPVCHGEFIHEPFFSIRQGKA